MTNQALNANIKKDIALELCDIRREFSISRGFLKPNATLKAVDGVSLRLMRGETLGLVGESGCGKSTLAKMLLGLLAPSSGDVLVNGKHLASTDRKEMARRIQPIFQDPYSSLNPRKTLREIVTLPLIVHDIGSNAERRQRVEAMMDVVGLPKRVIDSYPSQLSGGQRQRVAIARALVMRPDVLICDEPTSALDVSVQAQILNLLQDLKKEFGLTYLLISHNLAVIEHLADRVAVMYLGRIVEERSRESLFARPGHPYTQALLDSVLTPDPHLGIPDLGLHGTFPNPMSPPSGCAFHPRCPSCMAVCKENYPIAGRMEGGTVRCHLRDTSKTLELMPS
ncbi:putative peptide ABC transporter ATP-binding protein y4tS [Pseudomonas syringae pv. avii]|uniref:Peptide ABC transporter ATP-binding protein y4tS n=1 Tax=Pseudomonas syringae pv. avii TaxID=663959 RepID=A0ABY1U7E3_PSESX|nr:MULTISPECIES: oligopeptide/dipeptide ABC transporter ATP-binding protein [Pseudomonas syringae group]POQ08281.1 ABC transporter ATP-binding protein [Pseudomonas syringae pv. avii]RMR23473.1 Peptide ABC transporter, ATP-binding protein [Pseudomonas syringae pv. persicae]SOS27359.1 putative peptide ABC transporter ATP-binding protein y4tS [Pseudomonas syringae pv. avii]